MALCTVDYVRSKIFSSTLTDSDITDLITEVTEDVLTQCGTTDETDSYIILAGKYATLAEVLIRMKTTGELAVSLETPGSRRQNNPDIDIERYQRKSESFINLYKTASSYTFSSPSFNLGFSDCGGHHH